MKRITVIKTGNIFIRRVMYITHGQEYILSVQFGKTLADVLLVHNAI